jgi:hypothetical protein
MKTILSVCAALTLLASSAAFGDDWSKEETEAGLKKVEITRHVRSGKQMSLAFFAYVFPDCMVMDGMDVQKTRDPEHGMIELTAEENYVSYGAGTVRAKCNEKKVKGLMLKYKSALRFAGVDSFEIMELSPSGLARQHTFKIIVHGDDTSAERATPEGKDRRK